MATRKSRKKKKERDDQVTVLEKQIRELKAINRSLMKRLKKLDRNFHKIEDLEEHLKEMGFEKEPVHKNRCPGCSRGIVEETAIGIRTLKKCSLSCGWRQTVKA